MESCRIYVFVKEGFCEEKMVRSHSAYVAVCGDAV